MRFEKGLVCGKLGLIMCAPVAIATTSACRFNSHNHSWFVYSPLDQAANTDCIYAESLVHTMFAVGKENGPAFKKT